MNKQQKIWLLPVAGSFLLAAAAHGQTGSALLERADYLDSTNRLTGSLRFGLNITGKFLNPGGGLNPHSSFANGRRTPGGAPYNYDNGYVLTDAGGADGRTWYWGYDNSKPVAQGGQVNYGASTIDMQRTLAPGLPGENSADTPSIGAEVTYDHELGVKEEWHHLRYGVELAANYMPFSFSSSGSYGIATRTDTFAYTPGTTPPAATPGQPYQGGFGGPGFVIGSSPVSSSTVPVPGATLTVNDSFDASLWGFRLGPYVESPLTEKLSLHLTGGLAVGLVDANASWKETLTLPGGGGSTTTSGGGSDTSLLWGYYVGLDATYRFNDRWGADVGVQFQDLGTYSHDFGGRTAQLDLSQSVFFEVGVSYSF